MKKLLFLLLTLSIAFGAFAGSQSESGTTGEPVTVTYKAYTGPNEENLEYSETTLGAYLLEKFNVKIEYWPASETTYREELVTDAATNSLPDMLSIWVYPNSPEEILVVQKAAREGLLAGLNEAIDKYAPTVKKAMETPENWPIYTQEYMTDPTFNGETYFLPTRYTVGSKRPPGWSFVIRDDIKGKLGLETPIYMESFDEFLDILRDIKALEPVDVNGNPAWATGQIRIWNVLMATFTRLYDWGGAGGVDVGSDGKLVHYFQTDYPWQQILSMRKLYQEGLADPEALTHTFEVGREKVGQGKYVVEPFFAAGGTTFSYHKPTVEVKPEMSYDILGSFYTNKGPDAPLLVNNIGMQTHFLNAVSANADLSVVMPLIDFFATSEGIASNAYGVLGKQWDWDGSGNAALFDELHESYIGGMEEYAKKHGTGIWPYIAYILGTNSPGALIFDGKEDPQYPMNPMREDEINRRIGLAYNQGKGLFTDNKKSLASFMQEYPNKDAIMELLDIPYFNVNMMYPAYLAETEAEAREILDNYVASVNKAGLDDYMAYLQKIYDADPDKYILYESYGG